ncbi:MAG: hypothetical protein IPK79_02520 [Vampirovibrionales bacterium]|nr:hypothetical protein [Vampirovibrionales bacterium]
MKNGELMREFTRAVFHAQQKAVRARARWFSAARLPEITSLWQNPIPQPDLQENPAPPDDLAEPEGIQGLVDIFKASERRSTHSKEAAPDPAPDAPRPARRRAAAPGKPRCLKPRTFLLRRTAMTERDLSTGPQNVVCGTAFGHMSRIQRQRHVRRILRVRDALEWAEWLVSPPNGHPEIGRYRAATQCGPASGASAPSDAMPPERDRRHLHDRSPPQAVIHSSGPVITLRRSKSLARSRAGPMRPKPL